MIKTIRVCLAALLITAAIIASSSAITHSVNAKRSASPDTSRSKSRMQAVKKLPEVRLFIVSLDKGHGTRLLVASINQSSRMIYLARNSDVLDDCANALHAEVIECPSGRRILTRGDRVIYHAGSEESHFVGVAPYHSYGPVVDLRDSYALKSGQRYKVRFKYLAYAPSKVGHIKPWKGTTQSEWLFLDLP